MTPLEIADVVAKWTNIPVSQLQSEDRDKLVNLEKILRSKVVGQDSAISIVSEAIRRSRSGLSDPTDPLAHFCF